MLDVALSKGGPEAVVKYVYLKFDGATSSAKVDWSLPPSVLSYPITIREIVDIYFKHTTSFHCHDVSLLRTSDPRTSASQKVHVYVKIEVAYLYLNEKFSQCNVYVFLYELLCSGLPTSVPVAYYLLLLPLCELSNIYIASEL